MNGAAKIVGAHLDRLAVVYLRQSSMAQVRVHTESTMRQYGLVEEAVRLGWAREAVVVIDTDLGVSGRWGVARAGFAELVSRVCTGEVGAIFGLEISRLWPIGSRKQWWPRGWSGRSSRSSTATLTATCVDGRRWMRWARADVGVGNTTG